jgi:hypothetical protein
MPDLQVTLADVSTSRFVAHGDFSIRIDGDVLCYDVTGPFNLEWVQALGLARKQIVSAWQPKRRIGAIALNGSALMS